MKTRAVRLYGEKHLQLDEFELPEMKDDEILVKVVSNSICMSTYKAATLGKNHKRVPNDCDVNPIITGHEFAGDIVKVGKKWQHQFKAGTKFGIQPALNYKGSMDSPGYSFRWYGGNMEYAIIPNEVMEINCLINYKGEAYYEASLAEPMSCVIGGFHASYHVKPSTYNHIMDIQNGGALAVLGGCGPMGLGAIDYAIHRQEIKPSVLVVTDISDDRLKRANEILSVEEAAKQGVALHYVNPNNHDNPIEYMKSLNNGLGFDDVFVYVPFSPLVEQGDQLLGKDGCMNFFAGPIDNQFSSKINMYNIHYSATKIIGSTGGNTDDMLESIKMTEEGLINPAVMLTHIGGLDSAGETILNLPKIPGGKKIIYTQIDMPLTAIEDFRENAKTDPRFEGLAEICERNNNLWNLEAEQYLMKTWKKGE